MIIVQLKIKIKIEIKAVIAKISYDIRIKNEKTDGYLLTLQYFYTYLFI